MEEEKKTKSKTSTKGVEEEDTEMVIEASEDLEVVKSFDELGLREELLRGILAYGFNKPSAVQQRAILPITKKRDVIVQS
jgi:ATP-dependent RNA helicase